MRRDAALPGLLHERLAVEPVWVTQPVPRFVDDRLVVEPTARELILLPHDNDGIRCGGYRKGPRAEFIQPERRLSLESQRTHQAGSKVDDLHLDYLQASGESVIRCCGLYCWDGLQGVWRGYVKADSRDSGQGLYPPEHEAVSLEHSNRPVPRSMADSSPEEG